MTETKVNDILNNFESITQQLQELSTTLHNAYSNYLSFNLSDIINSLKSSFSGISKIYTDIITEIDFSAISNSMDKLVELLKIYHERDSVKAFSEENEPCVVDEIETIISEMPIDENAKDNIISSKEFKKLKVKEPWTRDQKLVLISIILGIIGFMINTIISLKNNSCETINNNVNVNVNINNNYTDNENQIKRFENTTEELEKILQLISEDINESDDDSCSIHDDDEYSLIPEPPLLDHPAIFDSSSSDSQSESPQ